MEEFRLWKGPWSSETTQNINYFCCFSKHLTIGNVQLAWSLELTNIYSHVVVSLNFSLVRFLIRILDFMASKQVTLHSSYPTPFILSTFGYLSEAFVVVMPWVAIFTISLSSRPPAVKPSLTWFTSNSDLAHTTRLHIYQWTSSNW